MPYLIWAAGSALVGLFVGSQVDDAVESAYSPAPTQSAGGISTPQLIVLGAVALGGLYVWRKTR